MLTLLVAWGIVTGLLIVVLIYRSALATHEDTQLFLDSAEKAIAEEKLQVGAKIDRLSRPISVLLILSGSLLLVTVALWLWEGLRNF